MRKFSSSILLLTMSLIVALGCDRDKKEEKLEPVISTFYLIRHAEKDRTDPTNKDPELNQDGLGRAIRWAEVFDPIVLDKIYSTEYERTMMTAAPTAVKKDIDVANYDPGKLDFEAFKTENEGLNVLVVGHSNTTPAFVNKLLGEDKYLDMEDDDNSSLFIVRIIDGVASDILLQMD